MSGDAGNDLAAPLPRTALGAVPRRAGRLAADHDARRADGAAVDGGARGDERARVAEQGRPDFEDDVLAEGLAVAPPARAAARPHPWGPRPTSTVRAASAGRPSRQAVIDTHPKTIW